MLFVLSRSVRSGKLLLLLGLVVSLLTSPAMAQGRNGQAEIRSVYEKSCRATSLKFLPAMLAHRSSEFKAYGPDQREINTLGEEQNLGALLATAISAEEAVEIVSMTDAPDGSVVCHVKDRLVLRFAERGKSPRHLVISTESKDTWKRTPLGWRQYKSQILQQSLEHEEALGKS